MNLEARFTQIEEAIINSNESAQELNKQLIEEASSNDTVFYYAINRMIDYFSKDNERLIQYGIFSMLEIIENTSFEFDPQVVLLKLANSLETKEGHNAFISMELIWNKKPASLEFVEKLLEKHQEKLIDYAIYSAHISGFSLFSKSILLVSLKNSFNKKILTAFFQNQQKSLEFLASNLVDSEYGMTASNILCTIFCNKIPINSELIIPQLLESLEEQDPKIRDNSLFILNKILNSQVIIDQEVLKKIYTHMAGEYDEKVLQTFESINQLLVQLKIPIPEITPSIKTRNIYKDQFVGPIKIQSLLESKDNTDLINIGSIIKDIISRCEERSALLDYKLHIEGVVKTLEKTKPDNAAIDVSKELLQILNSKLSSPIEAKSKNQKKLYH